MTIASTLVPDLLRAVAMFLAGLYLSAKVPVLRGHLLHMHWFWRGRLRFDDVRTPLFLRSLAAAGFVVYIVCDLATRLGKELTWRAPLAIVLLLFGLYGLGVTHRKGSEAMAAVRADPDLQDGPEADTFRR